MKQFLKMTFATVCGITVFMVIMGLFFVISLAGMIASEAKSAKVKDNSVFVIQLSGSIEELTEEQNPMSMFMGATIGEGAGLHDLISSIRKAKDEAEIKGIYLEGGLAEFDSPATAQQLRDALKDFKASGKWIVAYANQYLQGSYYVASVADMVYLDPTGMLDFRGLGGKGQYMKGLYDKIGVKYQVAKVGKYKSAVEQNTLSGMSDYDREQRTALYNGIWQHWLKDIAESRKLTTEALNQLAGDSILALADPQDLVKAKLIDKLMYPDELKQEIKKRMNIDEDKDIAQMTHADMMNVKGKNDDDGDEIAVYTAYGEIIDEATSLFSMGGSSIVGSKTVKELNKLADDDDVKAVVLRVNSPGGSAAASQQIWHAIKQLKTKKPVVVSMGGYAASGGYMISAAADYIIAEPTTVTGSIGIFGLIPNFSGLVQDKLGVTFDGVTTNQFTDWESDLVLSKENTEVMNHMQHYVDRGYISFLDIVADGRQMKREQVDSIAQGRVWIATDALKVKLVDKIGSIDDAVKKAAELAKVKEYHRKDYPGETSFIDQLLANEEKDTYLDSELKLLLGDLYEPVVEMRKELQRNRLQARLPFEVRIK